MTLDGEARREEPIRAPPDGTVPVAFEVQIIWCDYPSAAENSLFIAG